MINGGSRIRNGTHFQKCKLAPYHWCMPRSITWSVWRRSRWLPLIPKTRDCSLKLRRNWQGIYGEETSNLSTSKRLQWKQEILKSLQSSLKWCFLALKHNKILSTFINIASLNRIITIMYYAWLICLHIKILKHWKIRDLAAAPRRHNQVLPITRNDTWLWLRFWVTVTKFTIPFH